MKCFLASTSLFACVVLGNPVLLLASTTETYKGMCDGSAGIAIAPDLFVVANDDSQALRVYRRGKPEPLQEFKGLNQSLGTSDGNDQEADIEAAARIHNRVYWITSHGRDSDGMERETRRRFFATEIKVARDKVTIKPVQKPPYTRLLDDLFGAKSLSKYKNLLQNGATRAPEAEGGLNIEGLAATPQGHLLIGFRNPILPNGKALVVPLLNRDDVIKGKTAQFGDPSELKLGGLGIRSIDYVEARKSYWIIAGPSGDEGEFLAFPCHYQGY